MVTVTRSEENPILIPHRGNALESEATFNGCPVRAADGTVHFLYRALSATRNVAGANLRLSTVGYARSRDGIHFEDRRPLIFPEHEWEKFGCEDPRVTFLDGRYYIFYTALSRYPFDADGIKVAVAITRDFRSLEAKHLVTPFNAKAMALFPGLVGGKLAALVTVNTDRPPAKIALARFDHESDLWSEEYWRGWYADLDAHVLPLQRKAADQVELGAPPLRLPEGWLVIYSYIEDYLAAKPQFGVEAVLLDPADPRRTLGRTKHSLLAPEEEYEIYGMVPNIVFPSGALAEDGKLRLYYGAADTVCALAECDLAELVKDMIAPPKPPPLFRRTPDHPILEPVPEHAWEAKAVFNPGAWHHGPTTHLLYRAMSEDNTSSFGYAAVDRGGKVTERLAEPVYFPREKFEDKLTPGGNSGCEDPRLTQLDGKIYLCYTAFDGKNPPRIALSSIAEEDFLARRWRWSRPVLVSPPGVDDKDGALLPGKIRGKYAFFHRINNGIDLNFLDDLEFRDQRWLAEEKILWPRRGSWEGMKIGLASPPHRTPQGWLLLYHGVSDEDQAYHLGAALLDLEDPARVLGRTDRPVFSPGAEYEKTGIVPNVVFPCGSVMIGNELVIYYGGADRVTGTARLELAKLLNYLD